MSESESESCESTFRLSHTVSVRCQRPAGHKNKPQKANAGKNRNQHKWYGGSGDNQQVLTWYDSPEKK